MALQLTLAPDSPILNTSNVQRLSYYVNISGCHYIKQAGTYHIAVCYYADQTSAQAAPDANALSGTGLPRLVPAMRPLDVLATGEQSAYEVMYNVVKTHLLNVCGAGASVTNLY